jgi:hypothetical protein
MTHQPDLFNQGQPPPPPPARPLVTDPVPGRIHHDDPITSFLAANKPANMMRFGTQRHKVLVAFGDVDPEGLTSEEAGKVTNLGNYNDRRRCSELLKDGLLARNGELRDSHTGDPMHVLVITELGRKELERLKPKDG